jgi:hypothetical protein
LDDTLKEKNTLGLDDAPPCQISIVDLALQPHIPFMAYPDGRFKTLVMRHGNVKMIANEKKIASKLFDSVC